MHLPSLRLSPPALSSLSRAVTADKFFGKDHNLSLVVGIWSISQGKLICQSAQMGSKWIPGAKTIQQPLGEGEETLRGKGGGTANGIGRFCLDFRQGKGPESRHLVTQAYQDLLKRELQRGNSEKLLKEAHERNANLARRNLEM